MVVHRTKCKRLPELPSEVIPAAQLSVFIDKKLSWKFWKDTNNDTVCPELLQQAACLKGTTILNYLVLEEVNNSFFSMSPLKKVAYFLQVCCGECNLLCWGRSTRANDSKKRNKLIKMVSAVLGSALRPLDLIVKRRILHKSMIKKNNTDHSLLKIQCVQFKVAAVLLWHREIQ